MLSSSISRMTLEVDPLSWWAQLRRSSVIYARQSKKGVTTSYQRGDDSIC